MDTFYWHDYETFGADPRHDRPVQFAGVRTDLDLNIIESPLVIYCKPADDLLPQPEACLITGITPQKALAEGVCEADFIGRIHQQLARPATCSLGYNTIRFDDEVTRQTLYRNFIDPYGREWMHGNSRWDLIDVVRLTRALRPDGIAWPDRSDGSPSFRLEDICALNGLAHESAHDALSDVYATISLAGLIRQHQPRLFDYVFQHRGKSAVMQLLKPGHFQPVLHVSGRYPSRRGCIAMVVALCEHPTNSNGVVVYDLSVDPEPLLRLDADEIRARLYTPTAELPEGEARIPLKTVHINRAPVVVPLNTLRAEDAERLEIDLGRCRQHLEQLQRADALTHKIQAVLAASQFAEQTDPDSMLYSGGFFTPSDKARMERIRQLDPEQLGQQSFTFEDTRLPEMLFRYRARNYPETLSEAERDRWDRFRAQRLRDPEGGGSIVLSEFYRRLDELRHDSAGSQDKLAILDALAEYADQISRHLQ